MRKKINVCIVCVLLAIGCKEKKINSLGFSARDERIIVDEKASNQVSVVDSIISGLDFIKLETKPGCLVGEINKLIKYKNVLVVADKNISKNIFLFDSKGRFMSKLFRDKDLLKSRIKDVDVSNDTITVLTTKETPSLNYFNLKGERLKESTELNNLFVSGICSISSGILMYSNYTLNRDGLMYRNLLFKTSQKEPVAEYGCLPYQKEQVTFLTLALNSYYTKTAGRILLHEFANDFIYTFNAKTGHPDNMITIDFKRHGMRDKMKNPAFFKRATAFMSANNVSGLFDTLWENESYVFFNYLAGKEEYNFLWDKVNKKPLFNAMALYSQKSNLQIPTLWFASDSGHEILTYYSSSNIFSDTKSYSRFKAASEVFGSYRKNDNPVVCIMKLDKG